MIEYARQLAAHIFINDRFSLLSRANKNPVALTLILYLSILSIYIYKHSKYDRHLICHTHSDSEWTWYVNFFEASCFCAIVAIHFSRVCVSNSEKRDFGCYFLVNFISFIAGISSFINLSGNVVGNCEDIFGVTVPGVYWAEWSCCVPLLYYIVLTTEDKPKLTNHDIGTLFFIVMVFLTGAGLQFTQSYSLSVFLLLTSFFCEILSSVLFISIMNYKSKNRQIDIELRDDSMSTYRACLRKSQVELSKFLMTFLKLFPLVYLLSFFGVIGRDVTYLFFTLLNISAKLIFAYMINNAQENTTSEITRMKLVAEMAANQSRRLFVRYIMHEVRVPLNSLTMGLGYLDQCPNLDEDAQEALLMMDGATGFMKQTLNDVLNMQRIEEGKLELNYESFNIETMLSRVKASVQGSLLEKKITLTVKIQEAVPKRVIGDGFRIEHVIVNLVSNALKFSPNYSEIIITISALPSTSIEDFHNVIHSSTVIRFSVSDQGPGIAEADLVSLFTPFSQIQPNKQQAGGGSGVGLVICKQIVELHGGTISCQSTLGIGSIFTFSIPFEVCHRRESEIQNRDSKPVVSDSDTSESHRGEVRGPNRLSDHIISRQHSYQNSSSSGGGGGGVIVVDDVLRRDPSSLSGTLQRMPSSNHCDPFQVSMSLGSESDYDKEEGVIENNNNHSFAIIGALLKHVLLVDDVLSNRKLLAMLLKRHHIECSMASNGGEALQIVQNSFQFFDIIFMDNFMPVMNGLEATVKLREQGYPNLIIGLTGNAMEDDVAEFLNAGADAVLLKPISAQQLKQVILYVKKYGNAHLSNHKHILFDETNYKVV